MGKSPVLKQQTLTQMAFEPHQVDIPDHWMRTPHPETGMDVFFNKETANFVNTVGEVFQYDAHVERQNLMQPADRPTPGVPRAAGLSASQDNIGNNNADTAVPNRRSLTDILGKRKRMSNIVTPDKRASPGLSGWFPQPESDSETPGPTNGYGEKGKNQRSVEDSLEDGEDKSDAEEDDGII